MASPQQNWRSQPQLTGAVLLALCGCAREEALGSDPQRTTDAGRSEPRVDAAPSAPDARAASLPGQVLELEVSTPAPVFVSLRELRQLEDVDEDSTAWDLRFEGYRVFTNSGPSGPGDGASFGPSDELDLLFDTVPAVPLRPDKATGALSDWYLYQAGAVYSRLHVYGLRQGTDHWKLQILSYYGEEFGAEVSALYQLRYARVDESGGGTTVDVSDLDATGGGATAASGDSHAACLNLRTGASTLSTQSELEADESWHVCFRRNDAFTNSGFSGPGDVAAVDLDPGLTTSVEDLDSRTVQGERARFDSVDYARLTDGALDYAADVAIVSLIDDNWVEPQGADSTLSGGSWIVRGADGERHFVLLFEALEGASDEAPGRVSVRVKEVFE